MTEFIADLTALDGEDFNSSNIDTVAYDAEGSRMFVEFHNGNTYVYDNVAQSTYQMMVDAPSVGSFFNSHIMGKFTSHKDSWWLSERKEEEPEMVTSVPAATTETASKHNVTLAVSPIKPGRFGVKWTNGTLTFEPEFNAFSEADALAQFAEAIRLVMPGTETKIVAVTHYFD